MKRFLPGFLALCLMVSALAASAQTEQEQRIKAAYMLAFGRDASAGELTYWKGQGNRSVPELVGLHKQYIAGNDGAKREVIVRSYLDALGYTPSEAEIGYHKKFNRSYSDMMREHMSYVSGNSGEYDKVVQRSYQSVFSRRATDSELAYWRGQGKTPYLMLVSFHDVWKRKNGGDNRQQPSNLQFNMNTVSFAVSVPLSQVVAREAASVVGNNGGAVIVNNGGNVIGQNGASVVGNNGASVIGQNGASVIGQNGASVIGQNGASLSVGSSALTGVRN